MRVGISQPGGKTQWDSFWAAVNVIARADGITKTIVPRVRRSFDAAGRGLPANFGASTCSIDVSLGVISAYSWVPRKPGTSMTGENALLEGILDITAGNQDTIITAWGDSVPDGHLVDLVALHEWNAKVQKGVMTKAQYVAMAAHIGALVATLRSAKKPDQSWAHPKWRNQIRYGACTTGFGIRTGQATGTGSMLQALDVHTLDPYGKGKEYSGPVPPGKDLSSSPIPQTTIWWDSYVAPYMSGGASGSTSVMRGGAVWEASCRTDNTTFDAWPGTTNHRPLWIKNLLDLARSKGADYVSCFNSTEGGSQAVFQYDEDKLQLARWMATNADMSAPPTSWPARGAVAGETNQAPTAPTNFRGTVGVDKKPTLNWTASTDDHAVTGYTLSRNGTALTPSLSGTAVTFTEPTALVDGTYTYLLRAFDTDGLFSEYSPLVTLIVGAGGPPPGEVYDANTGLYIYRGT